MRNALINKTRDYHWVDRGGDWSIYAGTSRFLLVEGAGWSRAYGRDLFAQLRRGSKPAKPKPRR